MKNGEVDTGIELLKQAAIGNDVRAQFRLTELSISIGHIDLSEYEMSQLDVGLKCLKLKDMYDPVTDFGYDKTINLFMEAASKNDVYAQRVLGYLFCNGIQFLKSVKDIAKGVWFYSKAVEQGDIFSCLMLGNFYLRTTTEEYSVEKAIYCYKKGVEYGDITCLKNLIKIYMDKQCGVNDLDKAIELLNILKEKENGWALLQLAKIHSVIGSPYYDFDKTKKYCEMILTNKVSKRSKDSAAEVMVNLFKHRRDNSKILVDYYTERAALGDKHAMTQLGDYYCCTTECLDWYTKAAEQGDRYAQCRLGKMYLSGEHVPPDYAKAWYWYSKAAEQGSARALYFLGYMCDKGLAVAKNKKMGFEYYMKAAELGDYRAAYKVGLCYELGQCVGRDITNAMIYYKIAINKGDKMAKKRYDSLLSVDKSL